jgi:toxin ParE1/3/4
MQYQVRLSDRALRDLETIFEFIEADSSESAFLWFNELAKAIYSLERLPERGTVTQEDKKLRQLLFGKKPNTYRIIYALDQQKNAAVVLHIRHSARASLLTEPKEPHL